MWRIQEVNVDNKTRNQYTCLCIVDKKQRMKGDKYGEKANTKCVKGNEKENLFNNFNNGNAGLDGMRKRQENRK